MEYGAVIFDLDGVIRHWDSEEVRCLEQRFGIPSGSIAEAAFERALLVDAVTGRITDEEWRRKVEQALVNLHGSGISGIVVEWSRSIGTIDPEMVLLIEELRAYLRVGLLTNATTRLEDDLRAHGLFELFHAVCNSARLGVAKPEKRVFEIASELLGVQPNACIFVDDTKANVEAATASGMAGIHYMDMKTLRDQLRNLLVL